MTLVHFYEKPGCLTNAKQKRWLVSAGLLVVVHDLLQEPWRENRDKLRAFFGTMPVADWFNRNAPDIKNGLINPAKLNEQQALDLMVKQPLLIRRPLLEIENKRYAGFNSEHLNQTHQLAIKTTDSTESCSHSSHHQRCQS